MEQLGNVINMMHRCSVGKTGRLFIRYYDADDISLNLSINEGNGFDEKAISELIYNLFGTSIYLKRTSITTVDGISNITIDCFNNEKLKPAELLDTLMQFEKVTDRKFFCNAFSISPTDKDEHVVRVTGITNNMPAFTPLLEPSRLTDTTLITISKDKLSIDIPFIYNGG